MRSLNDVSVVGVTNDCDDTSTGQNSKEEDDDSIVEVVTFVRVIVVVLLVLAAMVDRYLFPSSDGCCGFCCGCFRRRRV